MTAETAETAPANPTLIVHCPPEYLAERRYAVEVVLGEWLGLEAAVMPEDRTDVAITVAGADDVAITMPDVLFATPPEAWLTPDSVPEKPAGSLPRPASVPGMWPRGHEIRPIPVVFGRPGAVAAADRGPDGVALAVDVLGMAFFALARYEEIARPAQDSHGRFAARDSILAEYVDRPLLDEHVELLADAIVALWPNLTLRQQAFRLWITHDVDQPFSTYGRPARALMRTIAADVGLRRDLDLAARRTRAAITSARGIPRGDPTDSFDFLMDVSERAGLRSTFFFLAGNNPDDQDFRYAIRDPAITDRIRRIGRRGHEIGLHGSYISHGDAPRLRNELAELQHACDALDIRQDQWGVRQHYLRFRAPETWSIQADAGFAYDSSVGFHDRSGFRAGTARRFSVYDASRRVHLQLVERPLIVMDVTLIESMALRRAERLRVALDLIGRCREHAGEAVLLVHNNLVASRADRAWYRDLVAAAAP